MTDDSSAEGAGCSYNTLDDDVLILRDFAFGMMDSQASRNTCPCRRAIHLGIGEDADIAAVVSRVCGLVGKDRPIEKTEVSFNWMLDRQTRIDGPGNHIPCCGKL